MKILQLLVKTISFYLPPHYKFLQPKMLQTQDLRVGQEKESCIRLTQENLIENSVHDCLPYILKAHSLC